MIDSETAVIDGFSWLIDYGYNTDAQLNQITYPNNVVVDYAPNALGQATKAGSYASNALYHPNGLLKSFTLGNGINESVTQTVLGQPKQFASSKNGYLRRFEYGYDNVNNITAITDLRDTTQNKSGFVYDNLDRLKNVTGPWGAASFTYDTVGNIKTKTIGSHTLTMGYNSNNRLSNLTGSATVTYGYDARGNITNNGRHTLGYNDANQLVSVDGGNDADYYYDGHGRRIKDLINGESTYSLYNQAGQLMFKYIREKQEPSHYIYLNNTMIAKHVGTPAPATPTLSVSNTVDGDGSYKLSWATLGSNISIRIEEMKPGQSWTEIYQGNGVNLPLTGRTALGTYQYRARLCENAACSAYSAVVSVNVIKPTVTASVNPTQLSRAGYVTVTWESTLSDRCALYWPGNTIGEPQPNQGSASLYVVNSTAITVRCFLETAMGEFSAYVTVGDGSDEF